MKTKELTGKHNTIATIKHSISNIGNLSPCRSRLLDHRLEHMSCTNDWLAGDITLGDHHLMGENDLFRWNLNAQITTGDHDTVTGVDDLIDLVDALLILDLRDDLDPVAAVLGEELTDHLDAVSVSNERGKDHIDVLFDAEE